MTVAHNIIKLVNKKTQITNSFVKRIHLQWQDQETRIGKQFVTMEVCDMTGLMNMTTKRSYVSRNRRKGWLAGIILFTVLLILSAVFFSKTVTAQKSSERTKMVTSVEIQKGDTLWSIASEYATDEYSDLNQYIEEIRDTNGLISDTIHAGSYILVPYYTDASGNSFTASTENIR